MFFNKSFWKELLFVLVLSLFLFMFPLAIYCLKTMVFGFEYFESEVRLFYFSAGILFLVSAYTLLLWKGNNGLIPFIPDFKISYVLLNLFGFLLFPLLLTAYVDSNFSKDAYEGVGVALDFVITTCYILFLNALSVIFFLIFLLLKRFFPKFLDKGRKTLSFLGYILFSLLGAYALYHLYKGRFFVANSEFLTMYTIFAIISAIRRTIPHCDQATAEKE